ncbi:hypothetical protein AAIA72_10775 [Hahella sp. SMD15-11]|uniref:DUF2231 domain-containing protein n=1 Tax=Thermohahella caldifontis TaxID=3142973 RepID=A0AB39USM1_9GAMM
MKDTTARRLYTRPLYLSIFVAVIIELVNFAIFGYGLNVDDASHFQEFIWTVCVGGLGMGSLLGVMIDVVVTGRLQGTEARNTILILTVLVLGIVTKFVTIALQGQAELLNVSDHTLMYVGVGLLLALLAGWVLGVLLYTEKGRQALVRARL